MNICKILTLNMAATCVKFAIDPPMMSTFPSGRGAPLVIIGRLFCVFKCLWLTGIA